VRFSWTAAILALGILLGCASAAGAEPSVSPGEARVRELMESGQYSEALEAAREHVDEVRAAGDGGTLDEAVALELLAQATVTGNRVIEGETLESAERALELRESLQGPENSDLAIPLLLIGIIHRVAGQPADGLDALRRAVEIREASLGPDDMQVAVALNHLGDALVAAGEYDEAEAMVERRGRLYESHLEPGNPEWIALEDDRALLAFRRGRYAEARDLFERVAEMKRDALGPEHPRYLRTLGNLAIQEMQLGEYAAARTRYEEVLAAWERKGETENRGYAGTLHNLGIVLKKTGDYAGAREAYGRALAIKERLFGAGSSGVTLTLVTLGTLAEEEGDYSDAWSLYEQARRIQEEALGPDHPDLAITLDAEATLLYRLGDEEASRRAHERALAIFESALGPDHPYVAMSLSNFALLLQSMGELDEAQRMLERSVEIRESELGPEHHDTAVSLGNLASVLEDRGDRDAALALYRRTLEIQETAMGPDHWRVSAALDALGDFLSAGGPEARAEARTLYLRSIAIQEVAMGPDHRYVAPTLRGLARLDLLEGRLTEALEGALRSEEISREHLRLVARGLAERKALEYADDRGEGVSLAVSAALASQRDRDVAAAWDAVIRSRSVVIDEIAARRRLGARAETPAVAKVVQELTVERTRLANLMVRRKDDSDDALAGQLIEETRLGVERLEEALAHAGAASIAEPAAAGIGYGQAIDRLDTGTALVGWVLFELREPAPKDPAEGGRVGVGESAPWYAAFVKRPGRDAPAVVKIGPRDEVDALVAAWRSAVVDSRDERAYRLAGEALRQRVWDPVVARLDGAARVLVVPDGGIHRVHWGTLPVGRRDYVVDGTAVVHLLSTERDLASPLPHAVGSGLLAVGGPDFDDVSTFASLRSPEDASGTLVAAAATPDVYRGGPPSCRGFGATRFESLPGSAAEIDDVIEIWKSSETAAGSEPSEPAARLTGSLASETAVKQEIAGNRVVHLATHGFVLDESCRAADLGDLGSTRAVPESPLRMSGLVFAGANHREAADDDEDDGILTAEEIATLDLSAAEWVVLSACDTGLGPYWSSEGILGLRRAFRAAGSRTLLMSLWPVPDRVTRRWVRELYRARFEENRPTAESVWEANRKLLDRARRAGGDTHPARWAALVGVGD